MVTAAGAGGAYETRVGRFAGTLEYMVPEARQGLADERTDQFAFAVSLWHALTDTFPFDARHHEWLPDRASDFMGAEQLPRRLARPLRRALQRDPVARFPSMDALLTDLREGSSPRYGLAALAAGVAVAIGAAFAWLRSDTGPTEPPIVAPPSSSRPTIPIAVRPRGISVLPLDDPRL